MKVDDPGNWGVRERPAPKGLQFELRPDMIWNREGCILFPHKLEAGNHVLIAGRPHVPTK